ncbi:tetratricopeptide repeat protein [Gallaecimonas pentaromativorans]|uniref:tetratricopeptide repeat protein n=1 Tax=Gallaecimonas pentaromativorans TaxID=584787 RepID=UPI003A91861B
MKVWYWLLFLPSLAWASAVDDLRYAMDHRTEPQYRKQLTALVDPAVDEAKRQGDPLLLGEMLYIKANIQSRVRRDYPGSLKTLQLAADALAPLQGKDALKVQMEVWLEQGSLNQYLGHFDKAEFFFSHALAQAKRRDSPKAEAMALYRIGYLQYRKNDIVQALSFLDEASLRLLKEDDPALRLEILSTKGRIFRLNHAYDKALTFLQQALALAQQLKDDTAIPDLLVGIAVTYQEKGDTNSALIESMHALDLYRQQNRPLSEGKALINIASLYIDDPNQQQRAREYLDSAVALYTKNKVDFYLGTALSMRAQLLADKHQAIKDLQRALTLLMERDSVSSWQERQKAQQRLADAYQALGDQDNAIDALRQAMALQAKLTNDDIQDGRQALERLTEQLNQADRLRQSEAGRLLAEEQRQHWRQGSAALLVFALVLMLVALRLWRHNRQMAGKLAGQNQLMTIHPLSGLPNALGLVAQLEPLMDEYQQAHNHSREAGLPPGEPLVLLSLNALFIHHLPMLAGIEESKAILGRFVDKLKAACSHCVIVAQLADDHLLLVIRDEPKLLTELYENLRELTARFVIAEGLEDVRLAVGFNLVPTLTQRSRPLPVSAVLELTRFTLAQADTLLSETRRSAWVSIQALELAPPSLLDGDDIHQQLLQALDRGLLQLRSGH